MSYFKTRLTIENDELCEKMVRKIVHGLLKR